VVPPELRASPDAGRDAASPAGVVWRFRVPDGETVRFTDALRGEQSFTTGRDFGDFVVWRKDDVPAYELAVVADDAAMGITEVVRGDDLLRSTARQLLVYRALGLAPPAWRHVPLVRDADGRRLAKRHQALAVRELRARGYSPEEVLAMAESPA
jgi:glutamyl-tRNA synthetase